jgi:hypothetical protein
VPVILPAGSFPLYYSGMTLKDGMHDSERLIQAYRKFFSDFESDTFSSPMMVGSAKASEIINPLNLKWPGHGLPDNASMPQFVEGEYMKADEYDLFLEDLSDFCLRRYLPRSIGALAPLCELLSYSIYSGDGEPLPGTSGDAQVRRAYQAIIDHRIETARWMVPLCSSAEATPPAIRHFWRPVARPIRYPGGHSPWNQGHPPGCLSPAGKKYQRLWKIVQMNISVGLEDQACPVNRSSSLRC